MKIKVIKTGGGGEGDSKTKAEVKVSNQNRADWNAYVDFLRTKGVAANPALDKDGLGFKYFDEYVKSNPKTSLTRDVILPIQKDLLDYRQYQLNNIKSGKAMFAEGVNEQNFMNHLSKVDGYPGQFTTSVKYPYEFMRYKDNVNNTDTTINKGFATIKPQ